MVVTDDAAAAPHWAGGITVKEAMLYRYTARLMVNAPEAVGGLTEFQFPVKEFRAFVRQFRIAVSVAV